MAALDAENLARFVVDEYNKKENATLQYKKVVNVKQSGTTYDITLEAIDGGKSKIYEAKVKLEDFKLIGDAPTFAPAGVASVSV